MIGAAIVAGLGVAGKMASGLLSARARRAEFDQEIRALSIKRDQTIGTAMARAGASGIELGDFSRRAYGAGGSASTTNFLRTMTGEFNRELDALRSARNTTFLANLIGTFSGGLSGGAEVASQYMKANPKAPAGPTPTYTPGSGMPLWRP